jgi:hypothetical protein
MADFNVRSEQVDVEQIMRRVRARIREKRGVDYTDQEVRELANVKLEKFLDPKNVRSDLVAHYRRQHAPQHLPPSPENFAFEGDTIYETPRSLLRALRRLLNPVLKLFMNPGPIGHVLHVQSEINTFNAEQFQRISQQLHTRDELDALNFEVLNNLVVEMTRLSIEVKNLKMRLESMGTRVEFDERRARALEGLVQYRPSSAPPPSGNDDEETEDGPVTAGLEGDTREGRTRRRRRRGRRRGPGGPGGDVGTDTSGDGGARQSEASSQPRISEPPPSSDES